MIRCGQMLYFETLRRIFKKGKNEKFEEYLKKFILMFNDNLAGKDAPYSIQNIVPEAYEAFNIQPGEWFRSTSILMSIERINEKFKPLVAEKIKMVTFVESIIYINVLHDKLYKENLKARGGKDGAPGTPKTDKKVTPFDTPSPLNPFDEGKDDINPGRGGFFRPDLSKTGYSEDQDYADISESQKEKMRIQSMLEDIYNLEWDTNVLISLATRIGVNQPEKRFKIFLKEILAMKQCVGILGGQNEKAYYIIGFHGTKNKFYYLDPHYVNQAVDPQNLELNSYLKKTVHEYNYKDMNSSMQVSFLIRGNRDFKNFMETLRKKLMVYGMDNSFITILETNQFDMCDGGLVEF